MKKRIQKTASFVMAFVFMFVQTQMLANVPVINKMAVESMSETSFQLNELELELAMAELNQLDNYLEQNQGATYEDVAKTNSDLLIDVSSVPAPAGNNDPLGIPSFLWGCVFGLLGVLLVYLVTDKDKTETKKAVNGCLVGTVVSVGLWFLVFAGSSAAATSY